MKVILLKDVRNVGRRFEVKDVSDGFAMNSLIPQRLAEPATPAAVKRVESEKKAADEHRTITEAKLMESISELEGVTVELAGKANKLGHLFAGFKAEDVAEALSKKIGYEIDPHYVMLDRPIKEAGDHDVKVRVGDKEAKVKVSIKAE